MTPEKSANEIDKKKETEAEEAKEAFSFAIGELCFILIPFVVIAITFGVLKKIDHLFYEPEWAIVASVMFGQSIVKVIHIVGVLKRGFARYAVGAAISIILLFGLVPSLVVLSILITSEAIPVWIVFLQMFLFVLAGITFFTTSFGQVVMEETAKREALLKKSTLPVSHLPK